MVTVMTCVNGIADAVQTVLPEVRPIYVGIILAVCAGFIVFGGFRRLADFASAVVPFMTAAYVILAFIVLITHLPQIPGILALVVKSALTPQAAFGGAAGYGIKSAFRYGMARGIFSNEAGQGTTCTISSASDARHPVTQALLGSLGVAVDTLFVRLQVLLFCYRELIIHRLQAQLCHKWRSVCFLGIWRLGLLPQRFCSLHLHQLFPVFITAEYRFSF